MKTLVNFNYLHHGGNGKKVRNSELPMYKTMEAWDLQREQVAKYFIQLMI